MYYMPENVSEFLETVLKLGCRSGQWGGELQVLLLPNSWANGVAASAALATVRQVLVNG